MILAKASSLEPKLKMDAGATIETYAGLQIHLLDPRPEEICIEDIAHSLSLQCRFTGHTKYHYSVAQHCYLASLIVSPAFALEALLHDATEAYLCDLSRPLKHFSQLGKEYLLVEDKLDRVIRAKFGLPLTMSPEVKRADTTMLYLEKDALMKPRDWAHEWGGYDIPTDIQIRSWTPPLAESAYLSRFYLIKYVTSKL